MLGLFLAYVSFLFHKMYGDSLVHSRFALWSVNYITVDTPTMLHLSDVWMFCCCLHTLLWAGCFVDLSCRFCFLFVLFLWYEHPSMPVGACQLAPVPLQEMWGYVIFWHCGELSLETFVLFQQLLSRFTTITCKDTKL